MSILETKLESNLIEFRSRLSSQARSFGHITECILSSKSQWQFFSEQDIFFYGGPRKNIWDVFEKPSEKSRAPISIEDFNNTRNRLGIHQNYNDA